MCNNKEYTSNVEEARLPIEEPLTKLGKRVLPGQIWNLAYLLENQLPGDFNFVQNEEDPSIFEASYNDSGQELPLLRHYTKFILNSSKLIKGISSVTYYSENLKDLIGEEFDNNLAQEDLEKRGSWIPKFYLSIPEKAPLPLAYGIGDPCFDIDLGLLTFNNYEAILKILESHKGSTIYLDFYQYRGTKGLAGGGSSLPFVDNIALLRKASSPNTQATIKVRGKEGNNTNYILPPTQDGFYDKNSSPGITEENSGSTGVIVLQENISSILSHGSIIDCGRFL